MSPEYQVSSIKETCVCILMITCDIDIVTAVATAVPINKSAIEYDPWWPIRQLRGGSGSRLLQVPNLRGTPKFYHFYSSY